MRTWLTSITACSHKVSSLAVRVARRCVYRLVVRRAACTSCSAVTHAVCVYVHKYLPHIQSCECRRMHMYNIVPPQPLHLQCTPHSSLHKPRAILPTVFPTFTECIPCSPSPTTCVPASCLLVPAAHTTQLAAQDARRAASRLPKPNAWSHRSTSGAHEPNTASSIPRARDYTMLDGPSRSMARIASRCGACSCPRLCLGERASGV